MSFEQFENHVSLTNDFNLASSQPERLRPLMNYVASKIMEKTESLVSQGRTVHVLGPDWCRENSTHAGVLHAEVITETYGTTYALPNKDPEANRSAIEEGNLDVYLMQVDGETTGTACLVNTGSGKAELGRSASRGNSGNSIIQDLRIFDWLTNDETAEKYHTLFTTLRSAPDRVIDDSDGDFTMRGGQAVTAHWQKFPGLTVNGFAPLYLKHGKLEQFSCALLSKKDFVGNTGIFVNDPRVFEFVSGWHDFYGLDKAIAQINSEKNDLTFEAHYPPEESGLTNLVHADIVVCDKVSGKSLSDCLTETTDAGSPFTQIEIPINVDTRSEQKLLEELGYSVFGYNPTVNDGPANLLFGLVKPGVEVVKTFWNEEETDNPFWNDQLSHHADRISSEW
jgi:hypothetical protein